MNSLNKSTKTGKKTAPRRRRPRGDIRSLETNTAVAALAAELHALVAAIAEHNGEEPDDVGWGIELAAERLADRATQLADLGYDAAYAARGVAS